MKSFDLYSIAIAINHLTDVVNEASQTNFFKDYFMPVFVVILSAITAYFIAIRGYQFQESAKNERMKADTLNSIVLKMQSMQASLIATKQNYFDSLGTHPVQRALNVPVMPARIEHVNFEANALAQLIYTKNHDIEKHPWMNIASYVSTFGNFNMFVELLNIRNALDNEVKHQISPLISGSGARGEISIKEITELLDDATMMKYIDLTEKFITLVDDLLLTLNDFMINFPIETTGLLKKKFLSNYVYLRGYENKSEWFLKLLKRCPAVDLKQLGAYMKFDEEETKRMYLENSVVIVTPKDN
ncbi:hypothetical protein NGC32_06350 [Kluyvera cryocrescens]|uniref:hypothetical protein n=1 Tax=Kluyvera cryocrescens TaxID=580 RepID=UPI002DB75297|nr:hypothetical protein [Kluyvera cryocrescens]MEB7712346.1 hypothetical protein [Kluyvera cryocrescens]